MLCHTEWVSLIWLNSSHKWHLVILPILVHGKQKQVNAYMNSNNLHVWVVPQKLSYKDFKLISKWSVKGWKAYGYYIQKYPWNRVLVSVSVLIVDEATCLSPTMQNAVHTKGTSSRPCKISLPLLCVWQSVELLFGTTIDVNHACMLTTVINVNGWLNSHT